MSVTASGVRLHWAEVPAHVRHAVTQIIGSVEVVSARSQPGGFSPGTADRLVTADGRRAFVKAVSPAQNELSPDAHRTEARVVGSLPPSSYLPALLGVFDDGEWVAAVYADIEGRPPVVPWTVSEIESAVAALDGIAQQCTPNPVPGLKSLSLAFAPEFDGWARLRESPPIRLDPWIADNLDLLCDLATHGLASLRGNALVHGDTRADNLIVRDDGGTVVVDWPWASEGAAWFDLLCLCINVDLYGGHDPETLARRHLAGVDDDDVTGALAGLCGFFVDAARNPAPPGLPTLRAFQAAQGESTLRWLRRRLASSSARARSDT